MRYLVARVAVALSCSAEQRTELMNLARSRTEEARLVERAKIVLACLEGERNDEVSRELGVRPNTVGLWRQRFAARGIAGLQDQPRPGKKPTYGEDLRLRILRQLELPAPAGLAGWDGGTLASAQRTKLGWPPTPMSRFTSRQLGVTARK
jgi:transposase